MGDQFPPHIFELVSAGDNEAMTNDFLLLNAMCFLTATTIKDGVFFILSDLNRSSIPVPIGVSS